MEGLWRLLIMGCVCHFLSSLCAFGVKIIGTPEECKRAKMVPGYNLAGEGLDIVTMQRKGAYVVNLEKWKRRNGSCTLMKNSHLSDKWQKLPTTMVDWRSVSECKMKVSSKKYESSESLVKDSTTIVEDSWKVGLDISDRASFSVGGTHSSEATFATAKSKEDKYSFTSQEVHCNFYRYRLASQLPLQKEFKDAIRKLPKMYSQSDYMSLIYTFGTHYIRGVTLGGRLKDITAIKSCKAAMNGLTVTEVMDCLEVEASFLYAATARLQVEKRHCNKDKSRMGTSQRFSSMFRERHSEVVGGNHGSNLLFSRKSWAYQSWVKSLKTNPGIVQFIAKPLFFLLNKSNPARVLLKKAIRSYIMKNALVKKCIEPCRGRRISGRDHCACVCHSNTRITANCCPARPGLARLTVYGLYGRKLYGDRSTQTDGSVMVRYGRKTIRTKVINNNDNPNWPETFRFGPIEINMATQLQFEVYDADYYWNSDLLGKCAFDLRRGTVTDTCPFQYGNFYFSYKVTCAPSLGGNKCQDYISSPMNPSQAKRFHSRNGFLAGEHWEALLAGNHSEFVGHGSGFEDHSGE